MSAEQPEDAIAKILQHPKTATREDIAAILDPLWARNPERARKVADAAMAKAANYGNKAIVDYLLGLLIKTAGLDGQANWADNCLRLLSDVAKGEISWPRNLDVDAIRSMTNRRIRSAIELAVAMADSLAVGPDGYEMDAWRAPFEGLEWPDRVDVLIYMDSYVDIEDSGLVDLIKSAVYGLVGTDGDPFEDGQDLLDLLSIDEGKFDKGRLQTYRQALDAYQKGNLLATSVRPKHEHRFLRGAVSTFAESRDRSAFEEAFDCCVAFELEIDQDRALVTAELYQGRLHAKAALIKAIVYGASQSNLDAARLLLTEVKRHNLTDKEDIRLLLEEARIYGGKDAEILAEIQNLTPSDLESTGIQQPGLSGRVLIVGGRGDFEAKIKRAFAGEMPDHFKWEHMSADAAKNQTRRLKQLVANSDGVLIWSWVISHAASNNAKAFAVAARKRWRTSSRPAFAAIVEDVAELLGSSPER